MGSISKTRADSIEDWSRFFLHPPVRTESPLPQELQGHESHDLGGGPQCEKVLECFGEGLSPGRGVFKAKSGIHEPKRPGVFARAICDVLVQPPPVFRRLRSGFGKETSHCRMLKGIECSDVVWTQPSRLSAQVHGKHLRRPFRFPGVKEPIEEVAELPPPIRDVLGDPAFAKGFLGQQGITTKTIQVLGTAETIILGQGPVQLAKRRQNTVRMVPFPEGVPHLQLAQRFTQGFGELRSEVVMVVTPVHEVTIQMVGFPPESFLVSQCFLGQFRAHARPLFSFLDSSAVIGQSHSDLGQPQRRQGLRFSEALEEIRVKGIHEPLQTPLRGVGVAFELFKVSNKILNQIGRLRDFLDPTSISLVEFTPSECGVGQKVHRRSQAGRVLQGVEIVAQIAQVPLIEEFLKKTGFLEMVSFQEFQPFRERHRFVSNFRAQQPLETMAERKPGLLFQEASLGNGTVFSDVTRAEDGSTADAAGRCPTRHVDGEREGSSEDQRVIRRRKYRPKEKGRGEPVRQKPEGMVHAADGIGIGQGFPPPGPYPVKNGCIRLSDHGPYEPSVFVVGKSDGKCRPTSFQGLPPGKGKIEDI